MPSAGGCGWWPPHDSVEGFGLARAFSYVRFPSGPEGRVSREARAGDARTRCRPVSRGRLFAPVSPARDPVPAPLHRRKASREVHRRILTGRFARFGIRFTPTRSGAASGFHLGAPLGAKRSGKVCNCGGVGTAIRRWQSPQPATGEKRPCVRRKSPKTVANRRQPPKNGTLSGPQRNKRSRRGILISTHN